MLLCQRYLIQGARAVQIHVFRWRQRGQRTKLVRRARGKERNYVNVKVSTGCVHPKKNTAELRGGCWHGIYVVMGRRFFCMIPPHQINQSRQINNNDNPNHPNHVLHHNRPGVTGVGGDDCWKRM